MKEIIAIEDKNTVRFNLFTPVKTKNLSIGVILQNFGMSLKSTLQEEICSCLTSFSK